MKTVKGYHGEWNMGSPAGWEYQRVAQILGKMAWDLTLDNVEIRVALDFEHPQINAIPGFTSMLLRAHENRYGRNPVHAVLLAEAETPDVIQKNKSFMDHLKTIEGVTATLAGPGDLSFKNGKVLCKGSETTVIFMDFNMNVVVKIGEKEDIQPIKEAIKQGILVNPRGMEPLGSKGLFEVMTDKTGEQLTEDTRTHTPWTRRFYPRSTTGPKGEQIEDLIAWTRERWHKLVLKPAHGYSGRGIFMGYREADSDKSIRVALDAGDYIVQQLVPLGLWSERSAGLRPEEQTLYLKKWQTDFRCFITDQGLQGFLARYGIVPTNVGSGGGVQPIAIIKGDIHPRKAADEINQSLLKLGYKNFLQIREEVDKKAVEMGFTYLMGPIKIILRPRLLTNKHIKELQLYARNLWQDAVKLEELWRDGALDKIVQIGEEERSMALSQPWRGSPALMVSDGLFSFGADLMDEA